MEGFFCLIAGPISPFAFVPIPLFHSFEVSLQIYGFYLHLYLSKFEIFIKLLRVESYLLINDS